MIEATAARNATQRILINKFVVPEPGRDEFMQRLRMNREYIETLPGFVDDAVFEQSGGPGRYDFVTMAIWESADALDAAKKAVYERYDESGFDPDEMYERLGIEADIAYYRQIES